MNRILHLFFVPFPLVLAVPGLGAETPAGTGYVDYFGYERCVKLENEHTRVVLGHHSGGRVLEYSWRGENAIYLDPDGAGWTLESRRGAGATGGRFDIGPEQTIPKHPQLWVGPWTVEIIGPRAARMTSVRDGPTGVQLVREFRLAEDSSKLACTQIIRNVSDRTVEYCHWSRTFAQGHGIVVIPLTSPSRFPNSYVMYQPDDSILMRPVDPRIRMREGFLEITGVPKYPKLGMDTYGGWFGYVTPNNLLFMKQFPADPDRAYNEVAGLTMSIWYPDRPMVELEPIGPRERLRPGESASFTETWLLTAFPYPREGESVDVERIRAFATAK
jgi:hypothetical protein